MFDFSSAVVRKLYCDKLRFASIVFCEMTSTKQEKRVPAIVGFLAGGVSGVFSRFLFYPLDTIKARLQVTKQTSRQNVFTALRQIWRREGILSFYSGFGSVLIFAIPGNACYFGGFEVGRSVAPEVYPLQDISAGVTAQLLGNLLFTPMDVIKERRQTGILTENPLFSQEGRRQLFSPRNLKGLFRGYWVTNSLWMPWSAIYSVGYNTFKSKARVYDEEMSPWMFLTCSTLAAALATGLTHPLDVVKTQLQVLSTGEEALDSMTVVKRLLRDEGLSGFYRGFAARMLTVSPSAGLAWLFYEITRKTLLEKVENN